MNIWGIAVLRETSDTKHGLAFSNRMSTHFLDEIAGFGGDELIPWSTASEVLPINNLGKVQYIEHRHSMPKWLHQFGKNNLNKYLMIVLLETSHRCNKACGFRRQN